MNLTTDDFSINNYNGMQIFHSCNIQWNADIPFLQYIKSGCHCRNGISAFHYSSLFIRFKGTLNLMNSEHLTVVPSSFFATCFYPIYSLRVTVKSSLFITFKVLLNLMNSELGPWILWTVNFWQLCLPHSLLHIFIL